MKKILVFVALFTATISINAQSLNGKTFVIQSMGPVANSRVLDADGYTLGKNGTKVQLWDKNGSVHQNWTFHSANKGTNSYYIVSAAPRAGKHKFLDANANDDLAKNGCGIQLWEDNGYSSKGNPNKAVANQIWIVTKNRNGTYRISMATPIARGASLDADGYTQNKNGGKVQLWQRLNNKNQAWKLISSIKTYKVGDRHPDGGIVVKVNKKGTHGTMMWLDDSKKFSHNEAKSKVASLGKGWQLPAWQGLQETYRNLHKTGKIKFSGTYYWSSWRPSKEFAKYVRFTDGYTSDGPARNKFNICPTKRF